MKKDFTSITQQIWNTKGINKKRALMHEMINMFAVKGIGRFKIHESAFKYAVNKARSSDELDVLASNIMLSDGNRVIK